MLTTRAFTLFGHVLAADMVKTVNVWYSVFCTLRWSSGELVLVRYTNTLLCSSCRLPKVSDCVHETEVFDGLSPHR